uniref:Uncharacterized protein MANES_05G053500 n=1 Tax=Rhizophora mucronata TaxID=61149 RepID=A0A2P2KKE0_RHIMU
MYSYRCFNEVRGLQQLCPGTLSSQWLYQNPNCKSQHFAVWISIKGFSSKRVWRNREVVLYYEYLLFHYALYYFFS